MKLSTKLTILSVALIAAAVSACCILVLSFTGKNAMDSITERGLSDLGVFSDSFTGAAKDNELTGLARRSYILDAFKGINGSWEYTLKYNGETLSNNFGFDVKSAPGGETALLNEPYLRAVYKRVKYGGEHFFTACCTLDINGEAYELSLVRNITQTAESLGLLAVKCAAGSLLIVLFAAAVMRLIVCRSLLPVKKLRDAAHELANGRYENRIPLEGKSELTELASDFNSMADAVEDNINALHERAERQQEFINDLSHELKTPVTSILLCSETLLTRKVTPEATVRALERIYDQGKWLERLSIKLMTLVMLQGEILLKPESVSELFDAVKASVSDALAEKGITLVTRCNIDVLPLDADLMRSALVNLTENAKRASENGQTIELNAYENIIEVKDSGKGIPPRDASRVTEPFYTTDRSRSKRNGGSGLGLALVKRIAIAHGARLEIDSVLGRGTAVRMIFPARE